VSVLVCAHTCMTHRLVLSVSFESLQAGAVGVIQVFGL